MGIHDHFHQRHKRAAQPDLQTLVSVVYVTAAPTFDGPIGGYTTVGVPDDSEPTAAPATQATQAATTQQQAQAKATSATAAAAVAKTSASAEDNTKTATPTSDISSIVAETSSSQTSIPSAITSPATSLVSSAPIIAATTGLSTSATLASSASGTAAAASSSSTSTSSSSSGGGMSAGGKAGLAIGILLLVATIVTIALVLVRKRKAQAKQELSDHEKQDPFADGVHRQASVQTTRTNPNAPRLSLRPVTQFSPNFGERRQSRGNALMTADTTMSEKPLPIQRPETPQSDRANPFGNHAETIDSANANGPAEVRVISPTGEIVSATAVAPSSPPSAAKAPAGAGLSRSASKRENAPKELDFTKSGPFMGPPSPAGTEFSTTSDSGSSPAQTGTGAAIAAAGGPANSTVHRVQLDFKPSMDDELELRAGQLIRLLHEYDDGWALCIRLDRSQQGVVPRTCLSTRPVKPRPQQNGSPAARGPPPGMRVPQQGRPMSPAGMQPRPMSPANSQGRPMSPALNNGPPRSMSPAGNRPMTPNGSQPRGLPQQGRPRSPSASQMQARRNSPPGPSRMNLNAQFDGSYSPPELRGPPSRKPVPGQAL